MRALSLDGVEPFKLPERSTRGRRMKELLGDEIEADDLFWSADLWNEDAEDAEFSEAESSEDEVDADFDAPEEEFEPAEEDVPEKTKPKKNKNAYVDPALKKHAKKKTTVTSEPVEDLDHQKDGSNDDEKPEKRETKKRRTNQASAKIDSPPLSPRIFRQSTVDSTERTRQRDIVSKGKKKRKTKLKSKGPRQMTQEDLLAEAKITEELNMESLKKQNCCRVTNGACE
ncbi:YL1 nuclear protein [Pelomyxa schiedti]|nr:YL1 nuclear protein [Pelomyxa schiedti]